MPEMLDVLHLTWPGDPRSQAGAQRTTRVGMRCTSLRCALLLLLILLASWLAGWLAG